MLQPPYSLCLLLLSTILLSACGGSSSGGGNDGDDNDGEYVPGTDGLFLETSESQLRLFEGAKLTGTYYLNDHAEDVTELMSCTSKVDRLTVSEDYYVSASSSGLDSLTCSYLGESRTIDYTVEADWPVSSRLIIGDDTMYRGTTSKWRYIASYPDGAERDLSSTVNWKTSNENYATVKHGLIKAVGKGLPIITARLNDGFPEQHTQQLKVMYEAPLFIEIEQDEVLYIGVQRRFVAWGNWADGDRAPFFSEVSWSASNGNLEHNNGTGTFTAVAEGPVTVSVEYEGVTAEQDYNVLDKIVLSVRMSELESEIIRMGEKAFVQAFAEFSDGTELDVSAEAEWKQGKSDPIVEFTTSASENIAYMEGIRHSAYTSVWPEYDGVRSNAQTIQVIEGD